MTPSGSEPTSRARRGLGLLVLAAVVAVVVLRALEGPDSSPARAAARGAPAAGAESDLAALERRAPVASARRSGTPRRREWTPPPAAERAPLIARFERGLGGQALGGLHAARDARRVALRADDGAGWHFDRHPVDGRRVRARQLLPAEGVVLAVPLPALLDEGHPASWAEATLWGLAPGELEALAPTDERRTAFGVAFTRHVPAAGAAPAGGLRELWWNAERGVALELRRELPEGELVQRLVALEIAPSTEALDAALVDPRERHPGWRGVDLVDFREEQAGH